MPAQRPDRTEAQVRTDLAAAYRLAAQRGWDDTVYTHISASVPAEPGVYLTTRSVRASTRSPHPASSR